MSNTTDIKKIIDKLDNLPTLPIIIQQILALLDNPNSTAKDINEVIKSDQSLTIQTLKLVNSSYYGFPRKIGTVTEAIVVLGFDTVRSLVLSASVCKMYEGGSGPFNRENLWVHTLAVAFAARIISKTIKYPQEEIAFVSGLLHDIAKVFEDQLFHDEFIEALTKAKNEGRNLHEVEQEILGYDHTKIGKRLSNKWNLPKSITTVIAYHHTPELVINSEDGMLPCIVSVADALVRLRKIGDSGNNAKPSLSKKVLDALKLKKEDLPVIIIKLEAELEKAETFLELNKS
jgi:putative nucleotidyltransferase with HDIG domain